MNIVIAGAGSVGTHLAKMLSRQEHNIMLIDTDEEKLAELESQLDILSTVASCTSIGALKDAEVDKCDLFIAVNPQEDQNINSAILAKKLGAKRTIARVNNSEYLETENAEYLRSIGCQVTTVRLPGLHILGEDRVQGVRTAQGEEIPCQGVFLLRASIAPTQMVPGLELDGNYVKVNAFMATNLPGVYAAGDCTGQPLQLAKAVGQGQIAAHHALGL